MKTEKEATTNKTEKKPKVIQAHGGTCPKGYIFDHNKNSPTYGRCIPIVKGTLAKKKYKNFHEAAEDIKKNINKIV